MSDNEKGGFFHVLAVFLRLGCTSFGGPVAHLGYFHDEFVKRRQWLDEDAYADLVALCQFLPGPASSQIGFAIGLRQGGLPGGLAAWLGFTLPSAAAMIAFGLGITAFTDIATMGWVTGLKVAAVAVVAQAVWGMSQKLCPDLLRRAMAILVAIGVALAPSPLTQVAAIIVGGVIGWMVWHKKTAPASVSHIGYQPPRAVSLTALALFFVILLGLPLLTGVAGLPTLTVFDSFYRSGSLVFGGGHVLLPLLQAEVVPPGWVSKDVFLAGYGAAQAVPGPLFSFAGYLGTVMSAGPGGLLGGVIGILAIFLPSMLLIIGVLPYWDGLRRKPGARAALMGANAAVVGLLLAALYSPVGTGGILSWVHLVVAIGAYCMLSIWKLPSWVVVLAAAGVGAVVF